MSQNEQKQEAENVLSKEIKSWEHFEDALREENRLLFSKMLSECRENKDYVEAAGCKDEYFSAESLFMVLILQQQRTINQLITKLSAEDTNQNNR